MRRHLHPKTTRRRALQLLAGCGVEGCTGAVMLAHVSLPQTQNS
jgi:hypothetical protein